MKLGRSRAAGVGRDGTGPGQLECAVGPQDVDLVVGNPRVVGTPLRPGEQLGGNDLIVSAHDNADPPD